MIETRLLSSMAKVYQDVICGGDLKMTTAFDNEPFSFQIAFKDTEKFNRMCVTVETDLPDSFLSEYRVGFLPVLNPYIDNPGPLERRTPGMCPDPLLRRNDRRTMEYDETYGSYYFEIDENETLAVFPDSFQSLYFTVNENQETLRPGTYHIRVSFYNAASREIESEETVNLTVLPASLKPQEVLYSNWFHYDCLSDIYNVEIFSDRYFEILRSYVHEAAKTGVNMMLLPTFTPALDTMIGRERKTAQLVKVTVLSDGSYSFDFTLLRKFIALCLEEGITHFEHTHLFTQWGAKYCPKVMAWENGEEKVLFGWHTEATGEAWFGFLKSYIPELFKVLNEYHVKENTWFHISDEPHIEHLEDYRKARELLHEIDPSIRTFDALSDFSFFEKGLVDEPIVRIKSPDMDKFAARSEHHWAYYTGNEAYAGFTNRLLTTSGAQARELGIQMYMTNAEGFLHWGYNYYYDKLSKGIFNPMINPCGYNGTPGSSYIVYPAANGIAIPSQRMKLMCEAFLDQRALKTLEAKIGRASVLKLIEDNFGKIDFRRQLSEDEILSIRDMVMKEICR